MHLITSPLGILAVLGLTNISTGSVTTSAVLSAIYCLSLGRQLPKGLWMATAASALVLVIASAIDPVASLGPWSLAGLIVVAYVGQDAAHWITGEVSQFCIGMVRLTTSLPGYLRFYLQGGKRLGRSVK